MKVFMSCALVLLCCSAAEADWFQSYRAKIIGYAEKTCDNTETCVVPFAPAPKEMIIEDVMCGYFMPPPNLGLRGARLINKVSNGTQWETLVPIFVGPQVIDSVDKQNVSKFDKSYASNNRMFMGYNAGDTPTIEVSVVKTEKNGFPEVHVNCKATAYYK